MKMQTNKRELLFSLTKKDFKIQTFRSGGKGGQHQNKTESGVRIIHEASGAKGESRSERSQYQNKKIAFRYLINSAKFKVWFHTVVAELSTGKTIDQQVKDWMKPENLQIEIRKNGQWKQILG